MQTRILSGLRDFQEVWHIQESLVEQMILDPQHEDTLLLLEHQPVYTIGRTKDHTSLHSSSYLPYPAHAINRGGQATYHGPGQTVGYPIINLTRLKPDLHWYVTILEQAIIQTCLHWGVQAEIKKDFVGVWVGNKKMASIGVGTKKWITMHGFACNILPTSLEGFQHITPCGINQVEMTCLSNEIGQEPLDLMAEWSNVFSQNFQKLLYR